MATIKLDNARFILTIDPRRRIIEHGSVLIENDRITRVGKATELAAVGADRVIDARAFVVTPGFFNGHMHVSYAHAVRGIYPDDVRDRLRHVFDLQAAMTEEEEYLTTLLALVELLKNGTVALVDPGSTKFPDACLQAYQDAGCRVILGDGVNDRHFPWKLPYYTTDECVSRTAAFIKKYHGRLEGRVQAWAMPFSVDTCTPELLGRLKRTADEHGTWLTMHHSSGAAAQADWLARTGMWPTQYLESVGVLGSNVLLAHVLGLHESEVDCIAKAGASATVCPTAAMKEGRGVTENGRLPELLERGVSVALGSDSANSSNHLDLVRSMFLAAIQYKDARQNTGTIPAETALELGTLTGAKALALGDQTGSIEVGKKADLVLFDTRRPEWQALFNPVNNLVYSADGRSVDTVLIDGRVVVERGRQTFADEERLFDQVQAIGERLQRDTGISFPRSRWPIE
ncbi:MAG: amidohydrolase family protein [Chloroflexota bacterium]